MAIWGRNQSSSDELNGSRKKVLEVEPPRDDSDRMFITTLSERRSGGIEGDEHNFVRSAICIVTVHDRDSTRNALKKDNISDRCSENL